MVEVKIPKEISEYEEKYMFGFTLRQSISLCVSAALSIIYYKWAIKTMTIDNVTTVISFIVVPILSFGFVKYHDLTLERYIYLLVQYLFVVPKNRKYDELDILTEVNRQSITIYENEMNQVIKLRRKK